MSNQLGYFVKFRDLLIKPEPYIVIKYLLFFSSKCLARRQLPLTIENDLTMIMALDDACLACCSLTLIDTDEVFNN